MKILHTSDWHLGKTLEGHSRLAEQEEFIEELTEIADANSIDLIIIAGDVYDSVNPTTGAEQLFYKGIKKLSKEGRRPILIIAGNHDSAERLTAASPLAYEWGIILLGTPKSIAEAGKYPHYEITDSGEGFVCLNLRGEKLVALTLPYPSEKRLNELIFADENEKEMQKSYSDKVGEIFAHLSKKFEKDSINIITGHFYLKGGSVSDSERDISIGGAYAVDVSCLPKAQYCAMGHLHRPQQVKASYPVYYSGSPIQYSKSETAYSKCVYIVDIEPRSKVKNIEPVLLRCYKPIEILKYSCIEDALGDKENLPQNAWVYLDIESNRPISQWEIKELRQCCRDIIEINISIKELEHTSPVNDTYTLNIEKEFIDFYTEKRGREPGAEVKKLFFELLEENADEAD